ncbi:hypothetical protein ACFX12_040583 [Malus domestica]
MVLLMVGYVWWGWRNGEMRWTFGIGDLCSGIGPLLKLAVLSCLAIRLDLLVNEQWQSMVENLQLANQELSIMIDLINIVETNDVVIE